MRPPSSAISTASRANSVSRLFDSFQLGPPEKSHIHCSAMDVSSFLG
ncbi:protein of unknown function [Cyanobium sp. NIES-981]|nr:protein of unknown function [Cyanobium sp. NIES-981]